MQLKNRRDSAFLILGEVLEKQHSLDYAFAKYLKPGSEDQAWIKALCFGVLRKTSILDFIIGQFAKKSLSTKDLPLKLTLYIGLYQLLFMEVKVHAAVYETVELAKRNRLQHASGFVNAILQAVLRKGSNLLATIPLEATYNHPTWLLQLIKQAYPNEWPAILAANNDHPPMFLRVNQRKISRGGYLSAMPVQVGIQHLCSTPLDLCLRGDDSAFECLPPVDVKDIPGFFEGQVSVQDIAAQQAAFLLELQDDQIVLDACAAPGGKTAHILEIADVTLIAVDQDAKRMERVRQNLDRLGLSAELRVSDALTLDFPDGSFDRILLDAPCSGTGVIRRHPDIRYLRRETDIPALAAMQQKLISHLWPMLKPGGILLYATCSILPQENDLIIADFLSKTGNAKVIPLTLTNGHASSYGWQFLPSYHGPDGFYYAKLIKI